MPRSLRETWAVVRWYVRGVVGADAYDRYAAHQAAAHPGAPVMTEREFWRAKSDDQDRNPKVRCC